MDFSHSACVSHVVPLTPGPLLLGPREVWLPDSGPLLLDAPLGARACCTL